MTEKEEAERAMMRFFITFALLKLTLYVGMRQLMKAATRG